MQFHIYSFSFGFFHKLFKMFCIYLSVVDRVTYIVKPVLLVGELEALCDVGLRFLSKAYRQRVARLADKARINNGPETLLNISRGEAALLLFHESIYE